MKQVPPQYPDEPPRRSWRNYINCRNIGCGLFLLLVLMVCVSVYVVIVRPPAVMDPLKRWLNAELISIPYDTISHESLTAQLRQQVDNFEIGQNRLTISQNQLRALILDAFGEGFPQDINVEIQTNQIKLFWDIEKSTDEPLWFILEFRVNARNQLYLAKMGTERIGLPAFLNDLISRLTLSAWQLGKKEADQDLLGVVMPLPDNIQLKGVTLETGRVLVDLDIRTGLDDLFQ